MRRFLVPSALVAVLATTAPAVPAVATPPSAPPANSSSAAARALEKVQEILSDHAETTSRGKAPVRQEATLALMDLRRQYNRLDGADRSDARAILARPNDNDWAEEAEAGFAWDEVERAAQQQTCTDRFCVHWVPAGTTDSAGQPSAHAATAAYVEDTIATLDHVWQTEVTTMGYARPDGDGADGGGEDLVDVFLVDTLSEDGGLHGYAVAEEPSDPGPDAGYMDHGYDGYMVLDNDQSEAATPTTTAAELLDVVTAHEFFHLVQFGYDLEEDSWLYESTATWMEEQVFDDVNDNLLTLAPSSLRNTWLPLDSFNEWGTQYGNWVYHQLTSERWGAETLLNVWKRAGSQPGNQTRVALDSAYKLNGSSFVNEFQMFTAASLAPRRYWDEGDSYYPAAKSARTWTLSTAKKTTGDWWVSNDRVASTAFTLKPDAGLTGDWKLRLKARSRQTTYNTGYAMVVYKDGRIGAGPLTFSGGNTVVRSFPFSARKVSRVVVTLGNASGANARVTDFRFEIWR